MRVTRVVGIDVSKRTLDVAIGSRGVVEQVPNTAAGCAGLAGRLRRLGRAERPELVVVEATGGLEHGVAAALDGVGLAVAVVNPRQARDFARCLNRLAKTDRIDARLLAEYGEAVGPEPRPRPDAATRAARRLVARRRQLVEMLTMEKNRLHQASPEARPGIRRHLEYLEGEVAEIERRLADRIADSPAWRETHRRLMTATGIGPVTATLLVFELPELGTLDRKAASPRSTATAVPSAASASAPVGARPSGLASTWPPAPPSAPIPPSVPSTPASSPPVSSTWSPSSPASASS